MSSSFEDPPIILEFKKPGQYCSTSSPYSSSANLIWLEMMHSPSKYTEAGKSIIIQVGTYFWVLLVEGLKPLTIRTMCKMKFRTIELVHFGGNLDILRIM
ncbi:hypothetical protein LINGRAHAP2_LOCUS7205, partial [Linum grandiflorum]